MLVLIDIFFNNIPVNITTQFHKNIPLKFYLSSFKNMLTFLRETFYLFTFANFKHTCSSIHFLFRSHNTLHTLPSFFDAFFFLLHPPPSESLILSLRGCCHRGHKGNTRVRGFLYFCMKIHPPRSAAFKSLRPRNRRELSSTRAECMKYM